MSDSSVNVDLFACSEEKLNYTSSIVDALSSGMFALALDLSGYGEEGWSEATGVFDDSDMWVIACAAWHRFRRETVPPLHLLAKEAARVSEAASTANIESDRSVESALVSASLKFFPSDLPRSLQRPTTSANSPMSAALSFMVFSLLGGHIVESTWHVSPSSAYLRSSKPQKLTRWFNVFDDGRIIDLALDTDAAISQLGTPQPFVLDAGLVAQAFTTDYCVGFSDAVAFLAGQGSSYLYDVHEDVAGFFQDLAASLQMDPWFPQPPEPVSVYRPVGRIHNTGRRT